MRASTVIMTAVMACPSRGGTDQMKRSGVTAPNRGTRPAGEHCLQGRCPRGSAAIPELGRAIGLSSRTARRYRSGLNGTSG